MNVQNLTIEDDDVLRLTLFAVSTGLRRAGHPKEDPRPTERELELYYTVRDGIREAVNEVYTQAVQSVIDHKVAEGAPGASRRDLKR